MSSTHAMSLREHLAKLRAIAERERAQGYPDQAVLDAFLPEWLADVRRLPLSEKQARGLDNLEQGWPDYGAAAPEQRAGPIARLLSWLERFEATVGATPPPAPPSPPPPASTRRPPAPGAGRGSPRQTATNRSGDSSKRGSDLSRLEEGSSLTPQTPSPSQTAPPIDSPALVAEAADLTTPLDKLRPVLPKVSPQAFKLLAKLGVVTVHDLLLFYPRRHNDYSRLKTISELEVGAEETVMVTVWEARELSTARGRKGTEAIVGDETGNMRVTWFNQPWLVKQLPVNERIVLSGKVTDYRGIKQFTGPEWEFWRDEDERVHTGRLVPVYPLTERLPARTVRTLAKAALDRWAELLDDPLPNELRGRLRLLPKVEAVRQMHFPDGPERWQAARRRLAFEELLLLQLPVLQRKREWQQGQPGIAIRADDKGLAIFLAELPFALTAAQQRVLHEILDDMAAGRPMLRLLQGEVGSGKTVVAAAAMLVAKQAGYQAALMAPTEILAEQHARTIEKLYARLAEPPAVRLLLGSTRSAERKASQQGLFSGRIDVAIGTHALIQEGIEFARLGLAIVDEQHRFGVVQRQTLREKGWGADLLMMTATPIPRSLAMTLLGDLDISTIDELPPGRQRLKTRLLLGDERDKAYKFLRFQVEDGRQAFVICPLVEESEKLEVKAATAEFERLQQEVFPDLKLTLLHGRMKAKAKDAVMRAFAAREYDILVSTAVVEVGIDIPNATVILIEGAERFGLAQLHQFRGRVGRGQHQSYCLLVSDSSTPEVRERLELMQTTDDGFALAEADLRLRGPGEFFGTRQSGLPDLRVATISDLDLLSVARQEANRILDSDPNLERPEHRGLAAELERQGRTAENLNLGDS